VPEKSHLKDCAKIYQFLRADKKPLREKEINMKNLDREYEPMQVTQMTNGAKHVLTGIVVGGVIGATAMLFLAPRSGEEMRAEVRDKAQELRDRTAETVKDTVSQVKSRKDEIAGDVKGKAQGLKHKGQDLLVEKLDRAVEAVEAAKKAIQEI
jgi:gas vesicle protein